MIRLFVIFGMLLAASYWVGSILGELHAVYQIRKYLRTPEREREQL